MKIAIIGAGGVGGSLGRAFAKKGHEIRFGARGPGKVADLVAECGGKAQASDPASAAAFGEVLFLTVPWPVALAVVDSLGDLSGKILADCTNPIAWDDGPVVAPDVAGSSGAQTIAATTRARVVKAFSTHGWERNLEPRVGDTAITSFLCGDDAHAKETVAGLARELGFDVVDAGPLRNAGPVENLAVLWVHLALKGGLGRAMGFRLVRA